MWKLRIGVVLDSPSTNVYIASFLHWLESQGRVELAGLFILRPGRPGPGAATHPRHADPAGAASPLSYRAVLWSEKLLLKSLSKHTDHLALVDIGQSAPGSAGLAPTLRFDPVHGLDDDTRTKAETLALDLLVDFSSVKLPLSVQVISRLGAVRIDYRRDRLTPSAPVGFWEPYFRIPKTRFAILRTTGGGEETLMLEGSFRTQFSYLLNQAHLYRKSLAQLQQMLLTTALSGRLPEARKNETHGYPPMGMPCLAESVAYLHKLAGRVSIKAMRRVLNIKQQWSIQVMQGDWRNVGPGRAAQLSAPPGHFWADPFLRRHDGRTYCFVEDYVYATDRAHISVLDLTGGEAVNLGVALKEDFHLSFPFMFDYDGEIYMCPEASQSGQIRIYRSTAFPLKWELCSIAMENISAADSMFFERGGKWWLLTSIDRAGLNDHCSELCLFYADSPLDRQWTPHQSNPVYVDAEAGRNAGLILEDGKIFRAAQTQGFDQYGEGLSVYEIVALDERHYQEVRMAGFGHARPSESIGSHHISTTGYVTVVDVLKRCYAP